MSVRAKPVAASASHTRLQHVLQAGMRAGLNVSTRMADGPNTIMIDGVEVSTDPSRWTELSVKQMVKLKLSPVDERAFTSKGLAQRNNPNAAYDRTEFRSNVEGPFSGYRFWVEHLGAMLDVYATTYYVLARPPQDRSVYRRSLNA